MHFSIADIPRAFVVLYVAFRKFVSRRAHGSFMFASFFLRGKLCEFGGFDPSEKY